MTEEARAHLREGVAVERQVRETPVRTTAIAPCETWWRIVAQRQRFASLLGEQPVERDDEVGRRVEQRPVEVEQRGARAAAAHAPPPAA